MNKCCYIYAISSCVRSYIYVGMSYSPLDRVFQHNQGKEKTTRPYKPFVIIIIEKYENRKVAREREKYLKSGCGKEFLKKLGSNSHC